MKPANWFGTVVLYTAITLFCVYFVPSNSVFSILRIFFGFTFVAFVPGYCLISVLFQERKLDFGEKTVLSVVLSFSIAGISGLYLGLSPIGINFASITESLGIIVIVLAFLAFLRKSGLIKALIRTIRPQPQTQLSTSKSA